MTRTVHDRCAIALFAKAPEPGAVKTRLIPLLGKEAAAALHRELAERALATARGAALGPVELWCAPTIDHTFFRECATRYRVALRAQRGADLGARMLRAARSLLAASARALIIGADCPALTADHLREADTALRAGDDALLIPAEDGGYVALGLSRCDATLFGGIEWGGACVLDATRARLRALGWRWREMPVLWDVDRPEDYHRLHRFKPHRPE